MRPYYLDTSALLKKYMMEAGSQKFLRRLPETDYFFTSGLTELELLVNFERFKKISRFDSPSYKKATAEINTDLSKKWISLIGITDDILTIAKGMIKVRKLRAPDAIQLGSALALRKREKENILFLCADHDLLDAARLEGLACEDVSTDD